MPKSKKPAPSTPGPIASVIVPAFNEEKNIAACLRALASQSLPREKYELIVSDGYSSDKTVPISKQLADKVVLERKRTIAAGRQKGAEAARGKILVFTDADTRVEKNWLEQLLKPFAGDSGAAALVAASYGALMPLEPSAFNSFLCKFLLSPYFFLTTALGLPSGAGSNLAVSAGAFRKAGGFDTGLVTGEDVELQKRVKRFGRMVFVPGAVARVSFRRVEKWGYGRFIAFHAANFFKTHFLGRPAREYERIR
ncbi:MAG: glycosyltransferase [Candidatus Micrarchaeota archaeon]|nr:glycosyltransferase [Candidatus Micrarchaeota archaeon]